MNNHDGRKPKLQFRCTQSLIDQIEKHRQSLHPDTTTTHAITNLIRRGIKAIDEENRGRRVPHAAPSAIQRNEQVSSEGEAAARTNTPEK
jgi:hypothetical protein